VTRHENVGVFCFAFVVDQPPLLASSRISAFFIRGFYDFPSVHAHLWQFVYLKEKQRYGSPYAREQRAATL
jgi:hypothetical protein